jgi:outer membrane biosynthesis protein TonB
MYTRAEVGLSAQVAWQRLATADNGGQTGQQAPKTLATTTTHSSVHWTDLQRSPLFTLTLTLVFRSLFPLFTLVAVIFASKKMQLKALTAIVSIAFTLGVHAAPNPFDRAAGVKDVLKRSYSHGMDMSQLSKRAMALTTKKRSDTSRLRNRRSPKRCKVNTTPSIPAPAPNETTPAPQQPETTPAPQQPETTPTPQQLEATPAPSTTEPVPSPAPEPTKDNNSNDTGSGDNNNNNNNSNNGSGNTAPDAAAQQWLNEHNSARAQHGAAPLIWDNSLVAAAEQWGSRCVFEHSGGAVGHFGENLAAQTGSLTPKEAVDMWMAEVGEYPLLDSPRVKTIANAL